MNRPMRWTIWCFPASSVFNDKGKKLGISDVRFATIALLVLALPATWGADLEWPADYRYGLESLERGQFQAAVAALEKAIAANPRPGLSEDPAGVDYLPYVNLAIAHYKAGHPDQARAALEQSRHHAVATASFGGRNLWDRYALSIMATDEAMVAQSGTADFREYERGTYTLDEAEAGEIKRQVLRRCALSEKVAANRLPWYFHYEFGLELTAAGDPQRGLDALILAANVREESKRKSRMYGMWFTDYLPYFRIAQAHSKLGNWRCAMDAMRLSARYSEFSPADSGFQDYSDLQKLILRHNPQSG